MKKLAIFALGAIMLAVMIMPGAIFAQSAESIRDFRVSMVLLENGRLTVLERITYDFGTNERHGIFRNIPTSFQTGAGPSSIDITVLGVGDADGESIPHQVSYGDEVSIKIGDPDETITGVHEYLISYTVVGAVIREGRFHEIYWNVTGNGWNVPIEKSSATLVIPEGAELEENATTCYTGYAGSTASECVNEVRDGETFYFESENILASGQGLTIVAGFPPRLVDLPASVQVLTRPSGASLYINDNASGYRTPHTMRLLPGEYKVSVKKLGYAEESATIALNQGEVVQRYFPMNLTIMGYFIRYIAPILIMLGIFGIMYSIWKRHGRDPKGKGTIIARYSPPQNLTPTEAGVLVDERAELHDLTAAMVYLATLGYIHIRKEEKKMLSLFKYDEFTLVKIKEIEPSAPVSEFERELFKETFAIGDEVTMAELEKEMKKFSVAQRMKTLREGLYSQLIEKGFYDRRPDHAKLPYYAAAALLLFAITGLGQPLYYITGSVWYFAAFLISFIVMLIFARIMSRRTKAGVETYEHLLGLKEFIKVTTADRIREMYSPENYLDFFEKLLPYAIIFKLEDKWAGVFEGMFEESPDWYEGGGAFSSTAFASELSGFSKSSQTSFGGGSSGGGGGFGGGSSGGGGGGGGGGSW